MKFVEGTVQTITSYEVANALMEHNVIVEMHGKEVVMDHNAVLQIIDAAKQVFDICGEDVKNFFIEHTYRDKRGRIKRYYDCTELGAEFIA